MLDRLIHAERPDELRRGLRWLYGFVRPQRRRIAGTVPAGVNRPLHTRLSGTILFALRSDLYRHLQTLSPAFYGRRRMGDLMSRLDGDVAEIQRFAVDSLLGLSVAIRRMSVSLMRVGELREAPVEVVDAGEAQPIPAAWQGRVEFDGVGFRHGGRADAVLAGARLTIPAGSKLALTGASGAGKSTLIDLLHRHYDPQAGSIRLDGLDLRAIPLGELRRAVAVVSQDIVLFRGTLADNIRYAAPQADAAAVREAARRACLDELVASLPQGPDTPIGERGQQLSGDQRQRIAIARALLQDPCVLVLDEATSAVDEATEAAIIAEVDALFAGCTRILISHRAATLVGCDLRVRLEGGRLEGGRLEGGRLEGGRLDPPPPTAEPA